MNARPILRLKKPLMRVQGVPIRFDGYASWNVTANPALKATQWRWVEGECEIEVDPELKAQIRAPQYGRTR